MNDYTLGQPVEGKFNTHVNGVPTTLGGSPVLACYEGTNTTAITAGITLFVDFAGRVGAHIYSIDTSNVAYAAGKNYRVMLIAGTVGGSPAEGIFVGEFSIENRSTKAIADIVAAILESGFLAVNVPIATAPSPTEFTLTGGPAYNHANVGAVFFDVSASRAKSFSQGSYVGNTGTLTLTTAPTFPVEAGDRVTLIDFSAEDPAPTPTEMNDFFTANNAGLQAAVQLGADWSETTGRLDTILAAKASQATADSILEDTGTTLPAALAALNNLSAADLDSRLAAYDSPTHAEMIAAFTQIKGATWSAATDTLEAIRDRGDTAWTSTDVTSLSSLVLLIKQMIGNKVNVIDNGDGSFDMAFRNDDDTATVRTIRYNRLLGTRIVL